MTIIDEKSDKVNTVIRIVGENQENLLLAKKELDLRMEKIPIEEHMVEYVRGQDSQSLNTFKEQTGVVKV